MTRPPAKRQKLGKGSGGSSHVASGAADLRGPEEPMFRLREAQVVKQWPFMNEPQEVRLQLVDVTGSEQNNKDVGIFVQLMQQGPNGVDLDQSRYLNIDKRQQLLDSNGACSFVFSIAKAAGDAPMSRPYRIVVGAESRSEDVPSIATWVSAPIHVVRTRLQVAPELSDIPEIWFKDKGGKRNVIKVGFSLRDERGNLVTDRKVKCKVKLKYESGETVPSQEILFVRPESVLMLNDPDAAKNQPRKSSSSSHYSGLRVDVTEGVGAALVRIDEVSKNHQGQCFLIEIGPDAEDHPDIADVGSLHTFPIAVRSKRNTSRGSRSRAFADTLPKFPVANVANKSPAQVSGNLSPQQFGGGGMPGAENYGMFNGLYHLPGMMPVNAMNKKVPKNFNTMRIAAAQAQAPHGMQAAGATHAQLQMATQQQQGAADGGRVCPKSQAAVISIAQWAAEIPNLSSIEWKLCGLDEKGDPLHYIPGNPSMVTSKILQEYKEHIIDNLQVLAETLQIPNLALHLKPSATDVIPPGHAFIGSAPNSQLPSPVMPVSNPINGGPNTKGGSVAVTPVTTGTSPRAIPSVGNVMKGMPGMPRMPKESPREHLRAHAPPPLRDLQRDNSLFSDSIGSINLVPTPTHKAETTEHKSEGHHVAQHHVAHHVAQHHDPQIELKHYGSNASLNSTSSDSLGGANFGGVRPLPIMHGSFERQGSSMDSFLGEFVGTMDNVRAAQVQRVYYVLAESYPNAADTERKICLPALDVGRHLMGFIVAPESGTRGSWSLEPWESFVKISNADRDYLSDLVLKHAKNQHPKLRIVTSELQISDVVEAVLGDVADA
mmetsp:Transcript_14796/g.44570  ORF Transcript_14796/g.44570 Transcript_14796/m.44570 type:complete len:828 (-) Transcript_14796:628-3111(-)